MLLFFTLWACSESDISENNNSNNGNEVSQNIKDGNDADTKTKAPLQKETPTFAFNHPKYFCMEFYNTKP